MTNSPLSLCAKGSSASLTLARAQRKIKRQVFEAFCLEIRFDKVKRRIEISATVSEAVAQAFESAKGLQLEAPSVTTTNIAGAPICLSERRTENRR